MAEITGSAEELNRALLNLTAVMMELTGMSSEQLVNLREETEMQKIEREQREKMIATIKLQKEALDKSVESVKKFYKALIDTSEGMTKYSGAAQGVIGALGDLATARLPGFGHAIKGAVEGLQFFTDKVFKQTENMVKAFDSVAQMGAGAALTAEKVTDLGRQAGFSTHNLEIFTKNARNAGTSLVAMGGSVSKGLEAFATFTNIGNDQLIKYRKLGLTQEALIEMQTKYLDVQAKTGAAMSRTPDELKKASLGYINNMLALAELTGKDLKQVEEAYAAAQAQENYNAYRFEQERKRTALLEQAETAEGEQKKRLLAEAERMDKTIKQRDLAANQAAMIGGKVGTGMLEMLASEDEGVLTESSASLATMGFAEDFQKFIRESNSGEGDFDQMRKDLAAAGTRTAENFGQSQFAFGGTSRNIQEISGMSNSMREFISVQNAANKAGVTFEQKQKELAEATAKEGKGKEDSVMQAQALSEAAGRYARELEDIAVEALNPFRGELLKTAASAVALAMAAGVAATALSRIPGTVLPGAGDRLTGATGAGSGPMGGGSGGGGGGGGRLGSLAKIARFAGPAAVVGMGANYASGAAGGLDTTAGTALNMLGTAATGAAIGSIIPGIGTAVGGLLGAAYGAYQGYAHNKKNAPEMRGKGAGVGSGVNDEEVKEMIMEHEGVRYQPYQDSLDKWTVGVGHLIGNGSTLPPEMNRTFSHEEVMAMFDKDYAEHKSAAERIPGYDNFNSSGKAALIDLTFNMGSSWYKQWPRFSKATETGDAALAAQSLQDSLWYKQVGNRAPKIVSLIANGIDQPSSAGIQAKLGGIASGPTSGFPATLHGNEMIQPLDSNSILQQLATTPAGQESTKMLNTFMGGSHTDTMEMVKMQASMIEIMAAKLDNVINQLELSNDIQDKMYKYASS